MRPETLQRSRECLGPYNVGGMTHTITLIPGDGIGPEVTAAVVRILTASGVEIEWERHDAGVVALERHGTTLPDALLDSIERNKVALKGPLTTPIGGGLHERQRRAAQGARPVREPAAGLRTCRACASRFEDVDLVHRAREHRGPVRRPRARGRAGRGREPEDHHRARPRRASRGSRSSTRGAHGRKRVTAVHKANIMKLSDGLFLDCVRNVSRDYPDIEYDERIVDAACMHLVMTPEQFDVLLLPNLYGDIVSDLCAGLVGGLGVGRQRPTSATTAAVFEAVHGSAPDIAGKNLANPMALLLSAHHDAAPHRRGRARRRGACTALATVLADGHGPHARPRRHGDDDASSPTPSATHVEYAARRALAAGVASRRHGHTRRSMLDDITQAVLAREDVARYLRGHGHGGAATARERVLRLPRRAADDAAVPVLPRAAAPALPDPAQDRRASSSTSTSCSDAREGQPRRLRLEPQEPHRLPRRAARARRQRHPAAAHRRGHQPVRRPARPASTGTSPARFRSAATRRTRST